MKIEGHPEAHASGVVIPFPKRSQWEPWVTKQQVANHFQFSTRWVEMRVVEGLPHRQFGSRKRFRLSEVERWLADGRRV